MKNLKIKNAKKVIFIENKANYIDYIQNKKNRDEFVIYHGGMYSPIKGKFFRKIYENAEGICFFHWSDIDIGGFKIFVRLRKIIPELIPYKMDKESFCSKKIYWKKMSKVYFENLKVLRQNEEYEVFFDVMDEMLLNKCKLEQEVFII